MSKERTWSVTYAGHTLSDIQNDRVKIPLPSDWSEVIRLEELGYDVWIPEDGSYVIVKRPK